MITPYREVLLLGIGLCVLTGFATAQEIPFRRVIVDSGFSGDGKVIGDLDGDGLNDLVIGGGKLVWYRAPVWKKTLIATGEDFGTDIEVGDVDNDGDLDIIAPDQLKEENVLWFENPRPKGNPEQSRWNKQIVGTFKGADSGHPHDLAVGDIDGNGTLDLVTRRGNTTLWLQADPGSWTQVDLPGAVPGFEGTALGDLDQDGDLDVVLNGYWIEAPPRKTDGSDWVKHIIDANWSSDASVAVADLNKDGRPDVVLARSENAGGRLSWFEAKNPKMGPWSEHMIAERLDHVHSLELGDVDNDGDADVIFAEMAQSERKRVGIFLNKRNGSEWALQVVDTTGSHNATVGDIGNDGDLDIAGANWQGPPVHLWENLSSNRRAANKRSQVQSSPEKQNNQSRPIDKFACIQIDDEKGEYGTWASPAWMKYFGLTAGNLTDSRFKDIVAGRYFYKNPKGDMTDDGQNWRRIHLGFFRNEGCGRFTRHEIARGYDHHDGCKLADLDGDDDLDILSTGWDDDHWQYVRLWRNDAIGQ